jgi:hypothetical protein
MRLQVASPCKQDWNKMVGDDRVRFCAGCKLNVYNVSNLTDDEVRGLVQSREGRVCARFFTRPDGTVLTRDCPTGVRRKRQLFGISLAAAASLLAMPVAAAPAQGTQGFVASMRNVITAVKVKLGISQPPPPLEPMMGDVAVVP